MVDDRTDGRRTDVQAHDALVGEADLSGRPLYFSGLLCRDVQPQGNHFLLPVFF